MKDLFSTCKRKMILFQIVNPVTPFDGNETAIKSSGGPLASLIARLWQTAVIVGALLVILYFVWGTIDWLTAGANEEKLKKARGRMINAFIGLALLVASFSIIKFLEIVFGFDLTRPVWPTPIP